MLGVKGASNTGNMKTSNIGNIGTNIGTTMQDQASHAVLDVRESERMVIFGRGKPTKFKCFYRTLLVRFYEFDLSEENIQSMIDEQNAHLNQKGFRYDDVLIRHLVVTMHDLGFEKDVLLRDKEYVAEQPYAMLWYRL